MKYHHNPALPWRNPESVPLDKIPEGWRLMLPGDGTIAERNCRLWSKGRKEFFPEETINPVESGWTYIIPSTVPLPEEFHDVTPEAKPVVTELRDWLAGRYQVWRDNQGLLLGYTNASISEYLGRSLPDFKTDAEMIAWEIEAEAMLKVKHADAMLKAREVATK